MEARRRVIAMDGVDLIERWRNAIKRKRDADREANRAHCELNNAEDAIGKWLVPKSAKIGEVFVLAVGGAFLEVSVTAGNGYIVRWRDNKEPNDVC